MMLAKMPSAEIRLRKSGGGVFEITVDGKLAYSKKATGRFPTDEEVLGAVASAQREMAAEWLRLADVVRRPRKFKQMQMG